MATIRLLLYMEPSTITAFIPAAVAIAGNVGVWLQTRLQRKVRLKVGDIEIEAPNAREAKELIKSARKLLTNERGKLDEH